MAKMRAVQVSRPNEPFEIVEREVPEPRAGSVRITVQACGICHSDSVTKEGTWPGIQYPRVPGHEIAGVIDMVGAGVARWTPGQRVGIGWHGSIINVSSIAGPMPVQNASVYSASKAAVDAITVTFSQELGPKKIRVNSLNPGMVETEGLHAAGLAKSDFRKMLESQTALGHIAQPEDIARAAIFFASDDSGWVSGQSLIVSGGQRQ